MGMAVIIPVYNTENYLTDCLDSVVNQTNPFEQVIIIDDGSTDTSLKVCKEYEEKYKYIKVISKENQGQGVARNLGLRMINSDYVMFLDSDDYIQKDTVEVLLKNLKKEQLDILYFDSNILNDLDDEVKKNVYDRSLKAPREVMSGTEYFEKCFPHAYTVSPCMVAFRTSFLKEKSLSFPETRIYEDIVFSFKAVHKAQKVQYIPNKLYVRRYRENSTITSELTYKKWRQLNCCYLECLDYILQNIEVYKDKHLESILIYLLIYYLDLKHKRDEIIDNEKFDMKVWEDVQYSFIERWQALFSIEDSLKSFRLLKRISGFLRFLDEEQDHLVLPFFESTYPNLICNSWNKYIFELKVKLDKLPLKEKDSVVGIYGTGYHTEQLLNWYKELCGNIVAKLYFIDTYAESGKKKYKDYPVINVKDIRDSLIKKIIISSNDYEKEIYENLKELLKEGYKIYCFYEEEREIIFLNYKSCFNS